MLLPFEYSRSGLHLQFFTLLGIAINDYNKSTLGLVNTHEYKFFSHHQNNISYDPIFTTTIGDSRICIFPQHRVPQSYEMLSLSLDNQCSLFKRRSRPVILVSIIWLNKSLWCN